MALTKCTECEGTISDKAFFCPHCGLPMGDPAHFFCYPTFLMIPDLIAPKVKPSFGKKIYYASGEYKGRLYTAPIELLDKYFRVLARAKSPYWNYGNVFSGHIELDLPIEDLNGNIISEDIINRCKYIISCPCGKDRHYISPSREVHNVPVHNMFEDDFD